MMGSEPVPSPLAAVHVSGAMCLPWQGPRGDQAPNVTDVNRIFTVNSGQSRSILIYTG